MEVSSFENLNVVVTGGRGGLGSAIVGAFHERGANVISADLLNERVAHFPHGRVVERRLDVTDEASWVELMDFVVDQFGGLDVLVNNAGIYIPNIAFEDMTLETWRRHFAVNSDGTFLGCKHAILRMRARGGGAIVNIGSGMSIKANPRGAAYCGSKAAVLMTTRTAAGSAGRYNIRVNAVLPGAVPTEMLLSNMVEGENEANFLAQMEAYSTLGRLATPVDIARAVTFLADPVNSAISGIYLPVDGGNMPGA